MKKSFLILILCIFFVYSSVCLAGSPKGLEKKGKTPKGFSQGEKSGWEGEYPKGWDKLNKEEKKEWLEKYGKNSDEDEDNADENDKDKASKNKHKKKEKKGKKK